MPPNLEWIATLPPGLQFLVMIGVGIGALLWGKSGYIAGKKEPPVTSKDVVLTAAGITDMQPMRDLVTELRRLAEATERGVETQERIADELGTLRQIFAEDAEERQDYRQWRKGFEAGQQQPQPVRRRRQE